MSIVRSCDTNTQDPSGEAPKQISTEEHGISLLSAFGTFSYPSAVPSCNPITLRWDPPDATTPALRCKLNLPLESSTSENLARLLSDMAPATFGRGGEHVFDESYRKAMKLDPSQFSVDFCPYECDIVEAIAQVLLPTLPVDARNLRGVRAELYKLNVSRRIQSRLKHMWMEIADEEISDI